MVVLDVASVRLEVLVPFRGRLLVGIAEQEKFELGAGLGHEPELARPLHLAAQDLARIDLDGFAIHGLHVAEDQRGLLQPGQAPDRGRIEHAMHVAVAG